MKWILSALLIVCLAGCKPTGKVDAAVNPQTGEIIVTGGIEWKKLRAREIAACKAASREQMKANMSAFVAEQNRLCEQCELCEYVEVSTMPPATIIPSTNTNALPDFGTVDK